MSIPGVFSIASGAVVGAACAFPVDYLVIGVPLLAAIAMSVVGMAVGIPLGLCIDRRVRRLR